MNPQDTSKITEVVELPGYVLWGELVCLLLLMQWRGAARAEEAGE